MQFDIKKIADEADMIINGYAFTNQDGWIRVLNLNCPKRAAVIYNEKIAETNMDDIENEIIMEYYQENKKLLTETGSAKFFVKGNGDTAIEKKGILSDREIRKIREFIKMHYKEMYLRWSELSNTGFYEGN